MRHFTSFEDHRHEHFVFVLQESLSLLDLKFNIMVARFRSKANLFRLRLVSVGRPSSLLIFLVLVLAEVHDSANRRLFRRRHLN